MRTISGALTLLLAVSLTGCGGDDSGSSNSTSNFAYYLDAAVGGINYTCGSSSGTTNSEGKFYFEPGKKCTFSLAYTDDNGETQSLTLKTISADETTNLTSGEDYQETDTQVAEILQSLDTNSDDSNAITISKETVTAVINAAENAAVNAGTSVEISSASSLLSAMTTYEDAVEEVITNVVTEEKATTHLMNTILLNNTMLDVGDDDGTVYASFTFSDSDDDGLVDTVAYVDKLGDENGTAAISFDDDAGTATIETTDADGNAETYTLTYVAEDDGLYYITLTNSSDSSDTTTERLYPSTEKEAAESYLMTTILTDATMYLAESDMSTPETWTYDADTVTFDATTPKFTVTSGSSTTTITITGFTEDYLSYTYTESDTTATGSGRMYYDSDTATTYLESLTSSDDSSGSSDSTAAEFTLDMVNGKTLYTDRFEKLVFDANTMTLQRASMLDSGDSENETPEYDVNSNGQLVLTGTDFDTETWTITGSGDNYYTVDITYAAVTDADVSDDPRIEKITVYTSLDALEDAQVDDELPTSVTDDSDDSTNTLAAGFELLSLTAKEISDGEQIQITLKANGSIPDALTAGAEDTHGNESAHYTNFLWFEVNGIDCNLSATNGTKECSDAESLKYSDDGKTVTLTLDATSIPDNDYDYLVVSAEMGADNALLDDSDNSDYEHYDSDYDIVKLAAHWSYDNPLVGVWVSAYDDGKAPFEDLLVIRDNENYVMTEQGGDDTTADVGGVEAGTYTLTTSSDSYAFSDAETQISTLGDTVAGETFTVYADDPDVLVATNDDVNLNKIESTDEHPEAGAWMGGEDDNPALIVFDGCTSSDGHCNYMEVDLDFSDTSMHEDDDGVISNATEFGTYVLNSDNTLTLTPNTDEDYNGSAGFSDISGSFTLTLADDTITFDSDSEETTVFNRIK